MTGYFFSFGAKRGEWCVEEKASGHGCMHTSIAPTATEYHASMLLPHCHCTQILSISLSLSLATKYYAKSRKPLLLMGIHMTHACKAACLCKNHAGHAACSSMQSSSWLISQHYMLCVCVCGLIVPSNCHM